jgi:hypothetical protein
MKNEEEGNIPDNNLLERLDEKDRQVEDLYIRVIELEKYNERMIESARRCLEDLRKNIEGTVQQKRK